MADTPSEQVVDVAELLGEVRRQLAEMASARGVELRTSGHFPTLYLDTGALELVLMNLISNAIKYSDTVKTPRFVEVTSRDSDGNYELCVVDNGLGIPAAARATVFERFTRAHAELDEQLGVDGTGLGLSIVDECVRSLGGTIAVESEEGLGTTFRISIPKKLPPVASA
jgi:two-component system, OmpR family, phosphate regulon sensor histidine kinase PhoR